MRLGTELESAGPAAERGPAKEMFMTLRAHQQRGSSHLAGASSGAAAGGSLPNAPCWSTGLSPGMLEFSLHLTCACNPY